MKVVDVIMLTYNHENFIAQAIEGVLMQQAGFDIKLYIADDASTDRTSEICKGYADKYPDRVNHIWNKKNLGAMTNLVNVFALCQSRYIALCDGDDYWTDPHKLQKQVDFLEANPGYAICFHAVDVLHKEVLKPSILNRSDKEETYTILDLAEMNLMQTPSVVFRNGLFKNFPVWFNESPVGDYIMHLLNAKNGLIKYLPEIMAVYRVHDTGMWGQYGIDINYPKWLWVLNKLLMEDFEKEVLDKIFAQKNKYFFEYFQLLLLKRQYSLIKETYHKYYHDIRFSEVDMLIDLFTKRLFEQQKEIDEIKSRKFYKLAGKLSNVKNKYINRFNKKSSKSFEP